MDLEGTSSGELDANKAVMRGKIRLKGDVSRIVLYNQAASRLGELSSQLGGRWFDELEPEGKEEEKLLGDEMAEKLM